MTKRDWKLTDQEIEQLEKQEDDVSEAQEAKKRAYIEAGGIILNPDALEDMYEALKALDGYFLLSELRQPIDKALAKAEKA